MWNYNGMRMWTYNHFLFVGVKIRKQEKKSQAQNGGQDQNISNAMKVQDKITKG